ncbi:MAG TPA: Mth938-like domain-containing protein [Burkholderiaceae bacterium]|nr:Mth938-like domain-containing protein [Burkholderiaceae bacterium]
MLLQREAVPALNTVTAYGDDYVDINEVSYAHAIHFGPEGDIHTWEVHQASDITPAHMRELAGLEDQKQDPMAFLDGTPPAKPDDAPEVVLVGTGNRQQFLDNAIIRPLLSVGIGVEVMTTPAAARTYNILMAEGRRIVVGLLLNKEDS